MNPDGSAKQRLYHSGCCVVSWAAPIWSPDGQKIAFAADLGRRHLRGRPGRNRPTPAEHGHRERNHLAAAPMIWDTRHPTALAGDLMVQREWGCAVALTA